MCYAARHRVRLRLWPGDDAHAAATKEMRQLISFGTDEDWESILDRIRARMRLPRGAMTLLDRQSGSLVTHHQPLRAASASGATVLVHVLVGKLVSKQIIFGRRRKLGNETVWIGASDLEEARREVASFRVKYHLSSKRERMLLGMIAGQLEAEVCWAASSKPWDGIETASEAQKVWRQSREDQWGSQGTGRLDPCTCSEGLFGAERYAEAFERRKQEVITAPPSPLGPDLDAVVKRLQNDGSAVLRGAISKRLIEALNNARCFNVSLLKNAEDQRFAAVAAPLVSCPAAIALAFHPVLEKVATAYMGAPTAVGGVNLRRSKLTSLPAAETLLFHSDKNQARFLKFFIYLTDVDTASGPFTYVRKSHKNRFRGWDSKYRWEEDRIRQLYGKSSILEYLGNPGDVVVADTTGFHRGKRVETRERVMLTVNYQIAPEYTGTNASIRHKHVLDLPPERRHITDFLNVIS